ncbi:hypothetical protein AB4Z45_12595 [Paenibacillus sp. MCAF9]|uniref:hypothetical protein n=1 Tax=Paenibacillus sp. MCAF9 TaxID=3233046 RepID=UPI003F9A48F0
MKSTIEKLEKQITDEQSALETRVAGLRETIIEDQKVLNTYAERFARAVQDEAGENEVLRLEVQRNEVFKRVEQNEEVVRILTTSNGSKLQRLKTELVSEHLKELKSVEDKAAVIYKGMLQQQKAIIDAFEKLGVVRETITQHKDSINAFRGDLSESDRNALGIPYEELPTFRSFYGSRNPIDQQMIDLTMGILEKVLSHYEFTKLEVFFKTRGTPRVTI